MQDQSTITITQVSNGWLVCLPYQPPMFQQNSIGEQIVEQITAIKTVIYKDPMLQGDEEQIISNSKSKNLSNFKKPLSEMKEDRLHIFKTFPEVLEFLKDKVSVD
jgi:hypothetical protein